MLDDEVGIVRVRRLLVRGRRLDGAHRHRHHDDSALPLDHDRLLVDFIAMGGEAGADQRVVHEVIQVIRQQILVRRAHRSVRYCERYERVRASAWAVERRLLVC